MSRAASLPGAELCFSKYVFFFFSTNHLPRAASLPGAELFQKIDLFFIRSHLFRAASLPGAELFPDNRFLEEATCPGQLRCLGENSFPENDFVVEEATCPGQLRCLGQSCFSFFEEATCPGQLRCLGHNFFSKKLTFRMFGTPVRRTRRRKSQKNGLSRILGLLCAEQDIGNLK